ncbi:MAG: hypothetical protein WCO77_10790 [bacterium]
MSNCARLRNSSQIVFQNRSIFPSVWGWCGELRKWCTRSRCSTFSNRVFPRQFVYCRPLSVSISLGTPYSPVARWYTSRTFSAVCERYSPSPTMYRE